MTSRATDSYLALQEISYSFWNPRSSRVLTEDQHLTYYKPVESNPCPHIQTSCLPHSNCEPTSASCHIWPLNLIFSNLNCVCFYNFAPTHFIFWKPSSVCQPKYNSHAAMYKTPLYVTSSRLSLIIS
jgi:hypothetical protein